MSEFKKYLEACNEPNPIPEEYLDWLVNGFASQLAWIESMADSAGYEAGYVGGGELKWGSLVVEFDTFPGSVFEGTSAHLRKKNSGAFENGGVWRCFAEAAKVREIEVRYENPAIALVQDPVTREVRRRGGPGCRRQRVHHQEQEGRPARLRRLREQPRDAA